MHWKYENYVWDVLNVRNYVRKELDVRELCKMYTECEKIV